MAHTQQSSSLLKSKKFHGFTLIELIVVITILAILGTIGFLSIGGYSSRARDSARVSDSAQIAKSLDVAIITAGDYPLPDNAFSVTYSGGVVWNQGVVGSSVLQFFRSSIAWGGLNKKPTDPLSNKEYVYSELAEGRAYQMKVDYEGDLNTTALGSSLVTPAFAAPGDPTIAYIRGNYGGLTAKTTTGGIVYVIAIPSIITNSGTTVNGRVSIESNVLSGSLLFHGRSLTNATTYNPNARANSGVVFSGASLPTSDASGQLSSMVNALKAAYGSTPDIVSNANIANLIAATGSTAIQGLGTTIVSSQLGGSAVSTGGGGGGGGTVSTPCSPGSFSATGNSPCTTSSAWFYVSSTGATSQTACVGGNTSPAGSTSSGQCVTISAGGRIYTVAGTYTWIAPSWITSINVICIGAGGPGGSNNPINGGGWWALAYVNSVAVTPGNSYTVTVGGVSSYGSSVASGNSSFASSCIAGGGNSGNGNSLGGLVIAGIGGNGGNGAIGGTGMQGAGWGGAGGYTWNGGIGSIGANNGTAGSGGGGGGGAGSTGGGGGGAGGGGVNVFGQWTNGIGGVASATWVGSWVNGTGGGGGSGGSTGTRTGGNYGGGVGGGNSEVGSGGGGVRIIWGTGRSFPSTNTSLNYNGSTEIYN